jgi:hypothetical protein
MVNKMSCILNAVDNEGINYLLLDCTPDELKDVIKVVGMDIAANPYVGKVKQYLNNVNPNCTVGMLKRNLTQLVDLLEMDFVVALGYEFDFSEPTSDYRYPIIKVKLNEDDEEWVEVKCENPEEYDEFMEWTLPKFVENVNVFFGSKGGSDYYIGKTQTGTYVYSKDKFTGNLSDDLFFELQD